MFIAASHPPGKSQDFIDAIGTVYALALELENQHFVNLKYIDQYHDLVVKRLSRWQKIAEQNPDELAVMEKIMFSAQRLRNPTSRSLNRRKAAVLPTIQTLRVQLGVLKKDLNAWLKYLDQFDDESIPVGRRKAFNEFVIPTTISWEMLTGERRSFRSSEKINLYRTNL